MLNKESFTTRKLVVLALMAAISVVLMFLEVPLPFLPPFLKLDISAVPVMIGSFMFGPAAGLMIAAVKALVHLLSSQTGGVGELADFIITGSFALTAGLVYKKKHDKSGAKLAAILSIFVIVAVGCLANWYILLPFYENIMPVEAIIAACHAVNPQINSPIGYIWFGVLPFNLIKGIIVSFLTFILYKRISPVLRHYADPGMISDKISK